MSTVDLQTVVRKLFTNTREESGRILSHRLSFLIDSEFRKLYKTYQETYGDVSGFCIIALGGYGRRELSPHSDLDILYLHKGLSDDDLSRIVNHFNNSFYNRGKEVGYSCRTITECIDSLNNLQTFNSFLDSRFLMGDDNLYSEFEKNILQSLPGHLVLEHGEYATNRLKFLFESSPPLHVSEPNLKNGPFGIRDIQSIYWIEKSEKKITTLSGLAYLPFFHPGEMVQLESAYDFYIKLRNVLHIVNGRKTDILSIPLQPEVCETLGLGKKTDINAIDQLMRLLYGHEMVIYKFIRLYLEYRENIQNTGIRVKYENFKFVKKGNMLFPDKYDQIFSDPENLYYDIIQLYHICQLEDLEPSPLLLSEIEFASNFLGDNFSTSMSAVDVFRKILNNGKNLGRLLTLMHRSGVLGKLIPEFGACNNFPLFSYHHQYTIDEHTLLILRELDRLKEGSFEIQDVQYVFNQCKNIDILALAILLHDAGKVREGDHCQYGAELAMAVGERLGYSEEKISLLKYLVESHIMMSELSTKRDTTDPELLKKLALLVGSIQRLQLLYVLTIIDTKSVGSKVLTNWKCTILRGLYENTLSILQMGGIYDSKEKSTIENLKQFLIEKEKIDNFELSFVLNFVSRIAPDSYLRYYTPRKIYHHYLVYNKLSMNHDYFHIEVSQEPSYLSISVYHADNKIFLSELTACVTSHSLNVIGLRTYRTGDGFFMETIQITDNNGNKNIPDYKLNLLKKNLQELHAGKLTVEDILSSPVEWQSFPKIPDGMVEEKIEFSNDFSMEYTILEIKLPDSPGLLYRIIHSIVSFGIEIHFVRVSTSADFAYDTFYLKNSMGEKITDPDLFASIKERITNARKEKIKTGYEFIEL